MLTAEPLTDDERGIQPSFLNFLQETLISAALAARQMPSLQTMEVDFKFTKFLYNAERAEIHAHGDHRFNPNEEVLKVWLETARLRLGQETKLVVRTYPNAARAS